MHSGMHSKVDGVPRPKDKVSDPKGKDKVSDPKGKDKVSDPKGKVPQLPVEENQVKSQSRTISSSIKTDYII